MLTFIQYPKCSTCVKARKHLEQQGVEFTSRHIVEEPLSFEELTHLYTKSGLPLKRFFNTSGIKYKELKLKDVLPTLNEKEQLELLASDGMLVKRPIIETKDTVFVGYKVDEYSLL